MPWKSGDRVWELGGGNAPVYRPNVDVRQGEAVDRVQDLTAPLPADAKDLDGIFSKFALEHVSWRQVPTVLRNIHNALKAGGHVVLVLPNTEAQMKWALAQPEIGDKVSQCLFGDQDYAENTHKAAFSPAYAFRIMEEAGFEAISVRPFGELQTDMVVEARKQVVEHVVTVGVSDSATRIIPDLPKPPRYPFDFATVSGMGHLVEAGRPTTPSASVPVEQAIVRPPADPSKASLEGQDASQWTPEQRKRAYNRFYFDGGRGEVGGYSREGYRDFPVHDVTFKKLMEYKPKSVLELGCARGFLVKRFQDAGIPAAGLDVSNHCYMTRACDGVQEWDLTQTPWPFEDKQFDFCYSMAVLEHIPANAIVSVRKEIQRVSARGVHGVDFGEHDDGFDKTHCLFRDRAVWVGILNAGLDVIKHEAVDKESLERGSAHVYRHDGLIKLNLGCSTVMYGNGWVNMDILNLEAFAKQNGYLFAGHDLLHPLPYKEGEVSLVHLSHVLEHFRKPNGLFILEEIKRVLKKGGVLRVAVPNGEVLVKAAYENDLGKFDEISDECAASRTDSGKLFSLMARGHQEAYDGTSLIEILLKAGFERAQERNFRDSVSSIMSAETIDQYPDLSLFVEAEK